MATSAMPFHVSRSAIDTVPDTVLIAPLSTPVVRSVCTLRASESAPPTWSPRVSLRVVSAHFWKVSTLSLRACLSSSNRPTTPLTCRWKFSRTVPTSRAISRRMSSASPVNTPLTMSQAPSSDTLSSSRRIASWVSCTAPAKSSTSVARSAARVARFETPSASSECARSICAPSGMSCVDTAVRDPATSLPITEKPVPRLRHCAAVVRNSAGSPDGQCMPAARNWTNSDHLLGGGTTLPFGPVGASTAVVSVGTSPTPPLGAEPPTVDAASALR